MAIHRVVFYGPDRHIRITTDPRGGAFTVERDLVFVAKFHGLASLIEWLESEGLTLADLTED